MRNRRKLASATSHGRWGEKTPKNSLEIDFPIARASVTQNNCFPIICVPLGTKDYLPNFDSRRIILGNCMSSICAKEKF